MDYRYNYIEPHDFESTEAFIMRCTLPFLGNPKRSEFLNQLKQIRDLPEVVR